MDKGFDREQSRRRGSQEMESSIAQMAFFIFGQRGAVLLESFSKREAANILKPKAGLERE